MDVKAGGRAGDGVCLRHGNSGPGAGSFHRRPAAGGHLTRQPMCRATTSHRVPVAVGTCSNRQAMAWIRAPRLYVPKTSAAVPGSCRPTGCRRMRRSTAAASDPGPDPARARPTESTESTRLGASSGRSWAAGRRRSMTSSTRRSAASAKVAAWRMGGDMTSAVVAVTTAVAACGCLLPCWRGACGARRRNVAWDDCRYWPTFSTFRVGGSYSATGMTAKVSRRGGLTGGLMVNGQSPTHRSDGEPSGEWQTSVVALCGSGSSSHNRARRVRTRQRPERAVTVGSRDISRCGESTTN